MKYKPHLILISDADGYSHQRSIYLQRWVKTRNGKPYRMARMVRNVNRKSKLILKPNTPHGGGII